MLRLVKKADFDWMRREALLFYDRKLRFPDAQELRTLIFSEAHNSAGYSIHPGEVQISQDLRRNFWWPNIQSEV